MAHWLNTGLSAQAISMRAGVPLPRSQVNAGWAWRPACNSRAQKAKTPGASCLTRLVSTGKLWIQWIRWRENQEDTQLQPWAFTHMHTQVYMHLHMHTCTSLHIFVNIHTHHAPIHMKMIINNEWINTYANCLKLAVSSPNAHLSIYSCFVSGEGTRTLYFSKCVRWLALILTYRILWKEMLSLTTRGQAQGMSWHTVFDKGHLSLPFFSLGCCCLS